MFKNQTYFSRYAWVYLAYNFYVVLGGTYVRATGSGAGCGAHWPLCKGKFIPDFSFIHTVIEFTHRAASGVVTLGAIILIIWAYTSTHKKNPIRKSALFVGLFVTLEALLGAALVLFSLVENDSSIIRAVMMALHLTTTFMLLASITLTAAWASNFPAMNIHFRKKNLVSIFIVIFGLIIVGSTGAITALGDTLFHPLYVGEGIISDLEYKSHILKSLRVYHPILAILISFYTIFICWKITPINSSATQIKFCKIISFIIVTQILCGFINILLLAPVWMQIVHLFTADILWVTTILFFNIALAD